MFLSFTLQSSGDGSFFCTEVSLSFGVVYAGSHHHFLLSLFLVSLLSLLYFLPFPFLFEGVPPGFPRSFLSESKSNLRFTQLFCSAFVLYLSSNTFAFLSPSSELDDESMMFKLVHSFSSTSLCESIYTCISSSTPEYLEVEDHSPVLFFHQVQVT